MPRPKKVVAPIKERKPRQKRTIIDGAAPLSIQFDIELRKECLQIAANNGSSISTLVNDAEGLYYFIKGYVQVASSPLPETLPPSPVVMSMFPQEKEQPDPAKFTQEHVRSKFDQLSM